MKNSEVNKMKKAKEQSVRDEADCSAILQAMNEKNLNVEILWTAMKHCKSHPSHTIEEAIEAGFTA